MKHDADTAGKGPEVPKGTRNSKTPRRSMQRNPSSESSESTSTCGIYHVSAVMYPQDAAALPLRSPASVMHITSACSAPPKDVRCERKDRAYEPSPQLRLLPINTGQGGAAAPQATAAAMLGGGPSHVSAPVPAGASPGRSIPPPKVVVAARGVGPITEPNVNDVLSGRGGRH